VRSTTPKELEVTPGFVHPSREAMLLSRFIVTDYTP